MSFRTPRRQAASHPNITTTQTTSCTPPTPHLPPPPHQTWAATSPTAEAQGPQPSPSFPQSLSGLPHRAHTSHQQAAAPTWQPATVGRTLQTTPPAAVAAAPSLPMVATGRPTGAAMCQCLAEAAATGEGVQLRAVAVPQTLHRLPLRPLISGTHEGGGTAATTEPPALAAAAATPSSRLPSTCQAAGSRLQARSRSRAGLRESNPSLPVWWAVTDTAPHGLDAQETTATRAPRFWLRLVRTAPSTPSPHSPCRAPRPPSPT